MYIFVVYLLYDFRDARRNQEMRTVKSLGATFITCWSRTIIIKVVLLAMRRTKPNSSQMKSTVSNICNYYQLF